MFIKRCPSCKSPIVKKNGKRNGIQLYKCNSCGYQFRGKKYVSKDEVWDRYLNKKQTVLEIAKDIGVSESTVKRRLHEVEIHWSPSLTPGAHGVVHIDCTYFGRNSGVIVALEAATGKVLYMKVINHEKVVDYQDAVNDILRKGYIIDGIVIDGIQQLFSAFRRYNIQMCQYHMCAIIRRKLTSHPRIIAAQKLSEIMRTLVYSQENDFVKRYQEWRNTFAPFLKEKTINPDTGGWTYTHRRLRSAALSVEFYIPYLFTYQRVSGMPNTNNKIEGTFTDLKKNIHNHSGMSKAHRKRFIEGFFKAWNEALQE